MQKFQKLNDGQQIQTNQEQDLYFCHKCSQKLEQTEINELKQSQKTNAKSTRFSSISSPSKSLFYYCFSCQLSHLNPFNSLYKNGILILKKKIINLRQEITFQLTQKQLKKLQQKKIHLELKCLQTGHPYEITFPLEAQFYVNNQLLGQFKKLAQNSSLKKRKDQELIFKHINFLKIGKNLLSFNISDDLKRKNYYFQLQLVKQISPENLIENYTKESKIIPIKNQIQDIKNNFSQEIDELMIKNISISLNDTFSMQQIQIPVKGIFCKHLQTFCLENYIKMIKNSNPKRFRCPICNQVAFQLVIDELMQFILNFVNQKSNPQICSEVIFNSKGGFFIKEDDDYEEIEFNHNGIKEENFIYLNQNFNGIQNQDSNENKKQNKIIVIEIDDEDDQENSEDNYNNYDKNNNYSSINIQKNAQSNNFYDNDLSFSNQQEEEKIQDNSLIFSPKKQNQNENLNKNYQVENNQSYSSQFNNNNNSISINNDISFEIEIEVSKSSENTEFSSIYDNINSNPNSQSSIQNINQNSDLNSDLNNNQNINLNNQIESKKNFWDLNKNSEIKLFTLDGTNLEPKSGFIKQFKQLEQISSNLLSENEKKKTQKSMTIQNVMKKMEQKQKKQEQLYQQQQFLQFKQNKQVIQLQELNQKIKGYTKDDPIELD